ncbi:hypothetical protein CF319_g8765, partial [Tilletia indica]
IGTGAQRPQVQYLYYPYWVRFLLAGPSRATPVAGRRARRPAKQESYYCDPDIRAFFVWLPAYNETVIGCLWQTSFHDYDLDIHMSVHRPKRATPTEFSCFHKNGWVGFFRMGFPGPQRQSPYSPETWPDMTQIFHHSSQEASSLVSNLQETYTHTRKQTDSCGREDAKVSAEAVPSIVPITSTLILTPC